MPDLFKRTMLKTLLRLKKSDKKKLENPGGWGGPPQTLWNGNSKGVGGLKLNDHPCGDMDIFWKHTI